MCSLIAVRASRPLQFPSSSDNDAISVSCLDLGYSVVCLTDTSQKEKPVIESSILLIDEHSAKATFDSLSVSFGSKDCSTTPSAGLYEPSVGDMETESAPHQVSRTPVHRYERIKRGEHF